MSQPEPQSNESSKMKKLLASGNGEDESPMAKLQRSVGVTAPSVKESAEGVDIPTHPQEAVKRPALRAGVKPSPKKFKFLPAFWTIASVMSFTVNLVLLIVLAVLLQNLSTVGVTLTKLPEHLLGGLYNNFVKMDQAHITTTIPVSKEIPVQFTLNVSGPTNVTLSEDVRIDGASVTVFTGGLNINNARANIVLPEGTVLPIQIENLIVPVDQRVLAELNVAVDIPLNQTELHEPFVGLRQVVEPFYCMLYDCP
jgi:hypothetical protein